MRQQKIDVMMSVNHSPPPWPMKLIPMPSAPRRAGPVHQPLAIKGRRPDA